MKIRAGLAMAFFACAAAAGMAGCGPSGPVPRGAAVAWKDGQVRLWDYGITAVNHDFKVEWAGKEGPRRLLCETGPSEPSVDVDPQGRLVVQYTEPGVSALRKTLVFASMDSPPEEKKEIR
jgi:hypothetical protein